MIHSKEKRCFRCKQVKPAEDFYRNRTRADGLTDECKTCNKELGADYYKRNRKRLKKAANKRYYAKHDENKAYARDYYWRNRDRILAKAKERRENAKALAVA